MCVPPRHQVLSAWGPKGDLVTRGLRVYGYAAERLPARCLWIDSFGRSAGDWLPGRKELLASLAGGVQCLGSQSGMHDAVALDDAASGLFPCSVGVLLSEHWSCCMDNVLFESRIAHTSLLCLVINCH